MNRPSGHTTLEFEGVAKAHGAKHVITDFSGIISRGEKIVLVGRNGTGKTTMLKALLSDAPGLVSPDDLDAGKLRWGHEVAIGYFPQDHSRRLTRSTWRCRSLRAPCCW